MAVLVAAKGPNAGQRFPLDGDGAHRPSARCGRLSRFFVRQPPPCAHRLRTGRLLHRRPRQQQRHLCQWHSHCRPRPFTERDELRIGPYTFHLHTDHPSPSPRRSIIRARVDAAATNPTLFMAAVRDHSAGRSQFDDITIVASGASRLISPALSPSRGVILTRNGMHSTVNMPPEDPAELELSADVMRAMGHAVLSASSTTSRHSQPKACGDSTPTNYAGR